MEPQVRFCRGADGVRIVIDVPQQVRNAALATGNSAWLDELPALVASLEADWSITVGRT